METRLIKEGSSIAVENPRSPIRRAAHPRNPTQARKALQPRAAFEQALDRSRAIPKDDLVVVNIDVPKIVRVALEALPRLLALRGELAALPKFEIENLDLLETYALALSYAYAGISPSSARVEEAAVKEQAVVFRDTLLSDCAALVARGLIPAPALKGARADCHANLPFGLLRLVALLRNQWPKISNRTATTMAELDTVEQLAKQLLNQRGQRQHALACVAEVQEQRQRNLTLLVRAYAQLRRGVAYLYWENGAVDRLAPSLYGGRGNHGRVVRRGGAGVHEAVVPADGTGEGGARGGGG